MVSKPYKYHDAQSSCIECDVISAIGKLLAGLVFVGVRRARLDCCHHSTCVALKLSLTGRPPRLVNQSFVS